MVRVKRKEKLNRNSGEDGTGSGADCEESGTGAICDRAGKRGERADPIDNSGL